jgi:anti-sigma factor RsiW
MDAASAPPRPPSWPRRLQMRALAAEGRAWSGPLAHLIGGMIDFCAALVRYLLERERARARG